MGLYDNYKVSLSNSVRPFEGSVIPELKEMKREKDALTEKALDFSMTTQDLLAATEVHDTDMEEFQKVNQGAQQQLQEIANSEDLAGASVQAFGLARNTARQLNTFATRKKQFAEREAKIDSDLTDLAEREYEKAKLYERNKAQADPVTGRMPNIQDAPYIKSFDVFEVMKSHVVGALRANGYSVQDDKVVTDADGNFKVSTASGLKEINKDIIDRAYETFKNSSPEFQQALDQKASAHAWKQYKNITEDQAVELLDQLGNEEAKTEFLKGGKSAKQVLEESTKASLSRDLNNNYKQYAGLGATRDVQVSTSRQPYAADGSKKKDEEGGDDEYTSIGSGTSYTTKYAQQSGEKIATTISDYDTKLADTDLAIAAADKAKQNAQDSGDANALAVAEANLADARASRNNLQSDRDEASAAQESIYNDIAMSKYGKSWNDLKVKGFDAFVKNLGLGADYNKMTKEDQDKLYRVFDSYSNGSSAQVFAESAKNPNLDLTTYSSAKKIFAPGAFSKAFYAENNEAKNVAELAKNRMITNTGNQSTRVSLGPKRKAVLKDMLVGMPMYDPSGTKPLSTLWDDDSVDKSKFEVTGYTTQGGMFEAILDGRRVLIDGSGTEEPKRMATALMKSTDPIRRQTGTNIYLNTEFKAGNAYKQAWPKPGVAYDKHPLSGVGGLPADTPIEIDGKTYRVMYSGVNRYNFIDLATGATVNPLGKDANGTEKHGVNFSEEELTNMLNNIFVEKRKTK
jgi:hypothetical protein